jgi:Tol biopolymer transport system component
MKHTKLIRVSLGATAVGLFLLVLLLPLTAGWGAVEARSAGGGTEVAYLPLIMQLHSSMATATPTSTNIPTATSTPTPTNSATPTIVPVPTVTPTVATIRVSIASDGTQGNAFSFRPSISADGRYILFSSDASNLVVDDKNGSTDIFVYDRQTNETTRVSIASDGTEGNAPAFSHSISADGRYVAFASHATNLVAGDVNGREDVFIHDRQTGQTSLVSVASDGTQGNGQSQFPSISADGRYIAFISYASNLVTGDINGHQDVFVHDRQTGQTSLISVASDGTQGDGHVHAPSISADGRFVAFSSGSTNLVSGDTNNQDDIFVHDQQTQQTNRVSIASDGKQGNNDSYEGTISANGRYVTFASDADNLVSGDANGFRDIFVHDQQTGETSLISVAYNGVQANGGSDGPSISTDGRYVAFASFANNLISEDNNGAADAFVYDRQTGYTSLVSIAFDGMQSNSHSYYGGRSVSDNGRFVTFFSEASNLVSDDTNEVIDVFVHDRGE